MEVLKWIGLGARVIGMTGHGAHSPLPFPPLCSAGGCCGVGPDEIHSIRLLVDDHNKYHMNTVSKN